MATNTDPIVTHVWPPGRDKFPAPELNYNFEEIRKFLEDRNTGTTSWTDLVLAGPEPWADPRAYGAVGDGTTDDRAAIQLAIDAVATSGGRVLFPALNFAIGNILYVPSNVTIQGSGMGASTISALSGTFPADTSLIQLSQTNGTLYTTASPGSNVVIRDIKLDCTGMAAATGDGTGQGLFVPNVSYFLAERVHIKSSQGYGIHLAADAGTYGLIAPHIKHCLIQDCGRRGTQDSIGGGYNTGAVIAFNIFLAPNGTAIDNVHVENALWIGNRSTGASGHQGAIWSDFGMVRSQIVDNYIENGSIHVYGYLAGGGQEAPHNVLIEGNLIKNGGSAAIYVSAANQVIGDTGEATAMRIIGNTIAGCIDDGVVAQDAPGCVIEANTINNWDTDGGAVHSAIALYGGPNATIGSTGCVIANNTGEPGGTTRYYTEATAGQTNNNAVFGNMFPTGTVSLDVTAPVSTFTLETPANFKGATTFTALTATTVPYLNGSKVLTSSAVTPTELGYLSGVTSAIQTQLGTKAPLASPTFTGTVTAPTIDVTTISHTGGTDIKGTNTNDAAAAGDVGEYVTATATNVNAAATTEYGDITSISLTAGDWDVSCNVYLFANGATFSGLANIGISTTSGNSSAGLTVGDNLIYIATASSTNPGAIANYRVSLSATTSVYLKYSTTYSAGTPQWNGRISARRLR